MKRARLHSVLLLVFTACACGGDDAGVSVNATAPLVTVAPPTSAPTAAPSPTPQPVVTQLPFIDNSKIPAAAAGYSEARIKVDLPYHPKPVPSTEGVGAFRFTCTFSHMSYDDPIVYPGKKGASHLHTFFGNTAIDYTSTRESIEQTGNSTCTGGTANRTGYWVPAIIDTKDGTPIKPDKINVYYKTSYFKGDDTKTLPAGLRMIAGDMKSSGPQEFASWNCYDGKNPNKNTKFIPADCPVGSILEAKIDFPFCWDGVNLDSPDHKSHMSYPVQMQVSPFTWSCPSTHPVELPIITEHVQYVMTEASVPARWRLSSDNYGTDKPGGYSLHADWFNGWDPKVQETWFKNCLLANMDCHSFLLGDGTILF